MATAENHGAQADETWDEHYATRRTRRGCIAALAASVDARGAICSSRLAVVEDRHASDGKSCFTTPDVRFRPMPWRADAPAGVGREDLRSLGRSCR